MDDAAQLATPANASVVAVIGGGVMGQTLVGSVAAAGWQGHNLLLVEPRADVAAQVASQHGATVTDIAQAAAAADVIVLAVKPQDAGTVLAQLRPGLRPTALVISIAAGLSTSWLGRRLHDTQPVVRAMPNTPAVVGAGITAISGGAHVTPQQLELTKRLLAKSGAVLEVPERDQDAVVAISGSGPAYAFYLIDAMAEAGVLLGLTRQTAQELAIQTVRGAAELLSQTGDHPALARERVSSPGGTTVAAVRQLDDRGVRAAVIAAATAARDRSEALGRELAD